VCGNDAAVTTRPSRPTKNIQKKKLDRIQDKADENIIKILSILSKILKEEAIKQNNMFQVFVNDIRPVILFNP